MPDTQATDEGASGRPTVEVRCESCLAVVSTEHAWDAVTCACGSLTVSGRPWRPTIAWLAAPGGGWSEAARGDAEDAAAPDGGGDGDAAEDAPASRPIGYRP